MRMRMRTSPHWYTVEQKARLGWTDQQIADFIAQSGIGKFVTRQRIQQMRKVLQVEKPSLYPKQATCKSSRAGLHYFIATSAQDGYCLEHRQREIICDTCGEWFGTIGRVTSCRKCRVRVRVREYYQRKRERELHHDSPR